MINLILSIMFFLNGGSLYRRTDEVKFKTTPEKKTGVCAKDLEKLKAKVRLEILMGCAEVNGSQVFNEKKLQKLYDKNSLDVDPE